MPQVVSENYERHLRMVKNQAPRGSTIFSVAVRGSHGQIVGARFYVAHAKDSISDITPMVATITGSKWDNVTGVMKTRTISDAVDLAGLRAYDDFKAFYHKSLY